VATITISLPDDQLARLRRHALEVGRSLDEVVQEAADAYLANLPDAPAPRADESTPASPNGSVRPATRMTPDGVRLHIPPDMSPEEAEALLAEPTPQGRRERLAAWLMSRGARVIEPTNDIPDDEWKARFKAVTEQLRQAGPTDLTPEEIEQEITLAREEARRILSHE
jgi:hypothetical protein